MTRVEEYDSRIAVRAQQRSLCTDAYGDLLGLAHYFSPMKSGYQQQFYESREWYTDRCILAQSEAKAFAMCRAKPHIQNLEHLVLFSRLITGRTRGTYGDEVLERRPGSIYVSDQARPFEAILDAHRLQSIYILKSVLGFHPETHSATTRIDANSKVGKLVHTEMDRLFATLFRGEDSISATKLDRFIAYLKIAMGAAPERADVRYFAREALFEMICQHIEANLGDADLSTTSLLQSFGVSRASLYRMFEANGGVRNYITDRRALRAMLDISQRPEERGIIRRAAERWGFHTQPAFNRTIQRIYGASPGRVFPSPIGLRKECNGAEHLFSRFASRTAAIC